MFRAKSRATIAQGIGSWYGDDFHGRKTANGEIFDMNALTAAHPTLPLPSYAYVSNLDTGRTILVRVNDRGPYVSDRIIDLSHTSARALGYEDRGQAHVRVRYAGRAPLNGDDRRERQFLAEQPWSNGRSMPAVAAYRPPQAPVAVPQPFPEGTPGRWSPAAYRAALAGKPTPERAQPYNDPRIDQRAVDQPVFAQPVFSQAVSDQRTAAFQPTNSPPPSGLAGPSSSGLSSSGPSSSGPSRAGPYRDDAYRPASDYGRAPSYQPAHAPVSSRAFVQVGLFRDRSNAERLRRELGSLGPVEVAPLSSAQGTDVYRVRLGPMSPSEANATAERVAARGVNGSAVVFE